VQCSIDNGSDDRSAAAKPPAGGRGSTATAVGFATGGLGFAASRVGVAASRMGLTAARLWCAAAWLGWSAARLGDASRLGVTATWLEPGVHPGAGGIRALSLHGGR
jgi:hypothetical protein